MFNNFGGGQSLGSLQWSFSAWAKSGTPCTYSVCKALRSVPGCLQMEFWSQDVLGILSIPKLVFLLTWNKRLEHVGAKGQSVVLCTATMFSDAVQERPAWWIVCVSLQSLQTFPKKMMSQQTLPAATMEIRLSQSQMAKICWMPSVYLLHLQCAQIVLTSNVSSKEAQVLFQETRFAPWSGVH